MGGDLGNFGRGGVVFEPSGGVKRFDLQGGGTRGEIFLSAAFGGHFLMFFLPKPGFSSYFS